MAPKRKHSTYPDQPNKLRKISASCTTTGLKEPADAKHGVLSSYYRRVLSLRDFLLFRLPRTSRARRRKVLAFRGPLDCKNQSFLDTTLIGILQYPKPVVIEARKRDLMVFTQTQRRLIHNSHDRALGFDISEVCRNIHSWVV